MASGASPAKTLVVEPILGARNTAQQAGSVGGPGYGGTVMYIPACLSSLRTSFEHKPERPRTRSTPRKGRKTPRDMACEPAADVYHPSNYLVRGGARAYEQKITNMNRAAVQDLRAANDMLASEVLRMRAVFDEERETLRQTNSKLVADLRLAEEKLKHEQEKVEQHNKRLRDLAKRLKEEHMQRLAAQAELAAYKGSPATQDALASLEDELNRTKDSLEQEREAHARLREAAEQRNANNYAELQAEVDNINRKARGAGWRSPSPLRGVASADAQALAARLDRAESLLHQKEALLAEALSSHAAQLEAWRGEATEVAQAAAKWKQRAVALQTQLAAKEADGRNAEAEARSLADRCGDLESETARLREATATLEGRLSNAQLELNNTKAQLKEALAAQASSARQAESAGHDAAQQAATIDRLTVRLAEESSKTSALRQDLAALTQQQVRELDAKSRLLGDLTAALHKEERASAAATREANSLRSHLATLERELRTAQTALASITDKQLRTQEAYEAAEMALYSAQNRASSYRKENKALLSSQYATPGQGYTASLTQQRADDVLMGSPALQALADAAEEAVHNAAPGAVASQPSFSFAGVPAGNAGVQRESRSCSGAGMAATTTLQRLQNLLDGN